MADEQETRAAVPALVALHLVIHPLWHDAWPNRDLVRIKEHIPALQQGVQTVTESALFIEVLIRLYHHELPNRNLMAVGATSVELRDKCSALAAAKLPKRVAARAAELKAAFTDLCAATNGLSQVTGSGDGTAVSRAIEEIHTKRQLAKGLFESSGTGVSFDGPPAGRALDKVLNG